ncbi:MAG: hypothetical protein BroJett026_06500 [Betaproteobacteria bacterium]|nr:MAG: hypothetical protein BroJett026_06500 [Betaproteobacteria bacterium]
MARARGQQRRSAARHGVRSSRRTSRRRDASARGLGTARRAAFGEGGNVSWRPAATSCFGSTGARQAAWSHDPRNSFHPRRALGVRDVAAMTAPPPPAREARPQATTTFPFPIMVFADARA